MKNLWFTSQLDGLNFTEEEVAAAVRDNQMLNLTLYISAVCNVKCPSCFISNVDDDFPELNVSNYNDILNQASELKIKSIKVSGAGEPLILKDTLHIVEKCSSFGIIPIVYTNGTTLGDHQLCKAIYNCDSYELIDILKRNKVSIVYKFNSGTDKVQDFMLGKESYSSKTYRGIFNLFYKGYNFNNKLAFQSIITPYNYAEAETLYRFCRDNKVVPYFETVLKKEKATQNKDLYLSNDEIKSIFLRLSEIDEKEYDIKWFPVPSYVNFQCTELLYGFLIDNFGYVRICPGIWEKIDNIRSKKIIDIWNSDKLGEVREKLSGELKGNCNNCKVRKDKKCSYGCRAFAYVNNSDIFGGYDECWWND